MKQSPTEDEVAAYREGYDNGAAEVWWSDGRHKVELSEQRDRVIEECARVAEQWIDRLAGAAIARAIRALKTSQ